jgi:hypothetical protein
MQCRADPAQLKVVHKGNGPGNGDYCIVPEGKYIRSYAVCIFQNTDLPIVR